MKIAITVGIFDVLTRNDFELLHQMRKAVVPNGRIEVIIFDDYSCYRINSYFPVQSAEQRKKNLEYICNRVLLCNSPDPSVNLHLLIHRIQEAGDEAIFIAFDDNKDFPGRAILKAKGIPIKFIKKQSNGQIKHN